MTYEIICVDDGSTDNTYSQLKSLQTQFSQLKIVRHAQSCGQSTAVHTGVKAAQSAWVATLDGDGQNDPADVPKLMVALTDGIDLVGGNRRDTWVKRMSSVTSARFYPLCNTFKSQSSRNWITLNYFY